MFFAEVVKFLFVNGTSFGLEVVPEVCKISARSSDSENTPG